MRYILIMLLLLTGCQKDDIIIDKPDCFSTPEYQVQKRICSGACEPFGSEETVGAVIALPYEDIEIGGIYFHGGSNTIQYKIIKKKLIESCE